jgi:hypothetical protein
MSFSDSWDSLKTVVSSSRRFIDDGWRIVPALRSEKTAQLAWTMIKTHFLIRILPINEMILLVGLSSILRC